MDRSRCTRRTSRTGGWIEYACCCRMSGQHRVDHEIDHDFVNRAPNVSEQSPLASEVENRNAIAPWIPLGDAAVVGSAASAIAGQIVASGPASKLPSTSPAHTGGTEEESDTNVTMASPKRFEIGAPAIARLPPSGVASVTAPSTTPSEARVTTLKSAS